MTSSIGCSCGVLFSSKKMAVTVLIVLNLVLIFEETFAVPDYKKLHENLSLRENSEKEKSKILRHQDGTLLTAEVGKVFKYSLQDFILDGQGNTPTSVSEVLFFRE